MRHTDHRMVAIFRFVSICIYSSDKSNPVYLHNNDKWIIYKFEPCNLFSLLHTYNKKGNGSHIRIFLLSAIHTHEKIFKSLHISFQISDVLNVNIWSSQTWSIAILHFVDEATVATEFKELWQAKACIHWAPFPQHPWALYPEQHDESLQTSYNECNVNLLQKKHLFG